MSAHNFTITRSSNRKHLIAVIDGPNMSSLGKRSKKSMETFSPWTSSRRVYATLVSSWV